MTRDLDWPAVDTQFRELAAAETILDEGYGPDSTYARERLWYNPLAPALVAAGSRISGVAPRVIVARSGPYLNLLAPLALFLLIATVFDRYAALAGVAAFVFFTGSAFPFYYAATYSPWFAPENFGQAILYVGLLAAGEAFARQFSARRAAWLGLLLGLTFLAHTAPALLLGGTMLILAAWHIASTGRWRDSALSLGLSLAIAFVVALPFAAEILWHYRLHILNPYPALSPSDLMDLNALPGTMLKLATLPALAGIAAVARRVMTARADRGLRLLLAWIAATLFFLGAHVAMRLAARAGVVVPSIVPPFHFLFYAAALVSVGIGVAVRDASIAILDRFAAPAPHGEKLDWRAGLVVSLATGLLVAAYYPKYLARADFTALREQAVTMNRVFPTDAYDWIRANTPVDAVFLCTDRESLYVVSPAGRKVVATNRYFSSPYVDWVLRDRDRTEMFSRLEAHDVEGFRRLAQVYGVAFIVVPEQMPSDFWLRISGLSPDDVPPLRVIDIAPLGGFQVVFRGATVAIVAVSSPRS
jgi:hypothetical protein